MNMSSVKITSAGTSWVSGNYKGYSFSVTRDHPSRHWAFVVWAPDGSVVCDGIKSNSANQRPEKTIIHALEGAMIDQLTTPKD